MGTGRLSTKGTKDTKGGKKKSYIWIGFIQSFIRTVDSTTARYSLLPFVSFVPFVDKKLPFVDEKLSHIFMYLRISSYVPPWLA